jgi:hypothetical protein
VALVPVNQYSRSQSAAVDEFTRPTAVRPYLRQVEIFAVGRSSAPVSKIGGRRIPQKLSIELDHPRDNFVSATFAMVATEFAEASQMVQMITGEIEPP